MANLKKKRLRIRTGTRGENSTYAFNIVLAHLRKFPVCETLSLKYINKYKKTPRANPKKFFLSSPLKKLRPT